MNIKQELREHKRRWVSKSKGRKLRKDLVFKTGNYEKEILPMFPLRINKNYSKRI